MKIRRGNVRVSAELLMDCGLRLLPHGTEIVDIRYDRNQSVAVITVDHYSLPEIELGDAVPDITCEVAQTSRYVA